MSWIVPRIWQGGDAWIIGGGPSITRQFEIPDEVVAKVLRKELPISSYEAYLGAIRHKHTIGVNIAFLLGDWIDFAFFGDKGFLLKWQNDLKQFPKPKVSCNPVATKYSWIKFLDKDRNKNFGISNKPGRVSWNNNSGAAAINFAVHLGAKRIFLLGFDMQLVDNHQHWHSQYHVGKSKPKSLPFDMHLRAFPDIATDAKKMGIEIINVSPDSRINVFPKVSLKEALQ